MTLFFKWSGIVLTLQRPGGPHGPLSPKFQSYFKKGPSKKKKKSYERRAYESVEEKSLS